MLWKKEAIYIMTNPRNTVLYTGVTSRLKERIWEHKSKQYQTSFTARYKISKLVYFEEYSSIQEAIEREKQIKAGSRLKKILLIESINPDWNDLFDLL
jgi:putative endonuclease